MENDELKSLWKTIATPQKSDLTLAEMLKASNHPILKAIKRQLVFELLAFTAFLFCYYSLFDGADKPLLTNLAMIFAILINILHHLKGYHMQQHFRASENLHTNLKQFAAKLNAYQLETLMVKIIFIIGMVIFFSYGIQFTEKKWWAVGFIAILSIAQLILLNKIWSKRKAQLESTIKEFENS